MPAMRLIPLLVLAVSVLVSGQQPPTGAAVASLIEAELRAAKVPGASIAVVSGDEVFAGSYGLADVTAGTPMTPDTLMHSGSLTKLFTALAVTTVLEQRNVDANTRVGAFMTGLAPPAVDATFHQLLSQTAGMRDRAGDTGTDAESELAANARRMAAADFILPGGVVFSYSNLGYSLAGAALEAMVKKPFADALRESVLSPIGMRLSTMRPAEALRRAHAEGHRIESAATVVTGMANDTRIWPAGYLWTNATDMSLALSALMSKGRVKGHPGLPAPVVERVSTPQTAMPNVFVDGHYGYGLMIARDRGMLFWEHGGTLPGFSTILRVAPERRLGIAILANLDNAPLRRVAQVVMARALSLPDLQAPSRQESAVTPGEMKPLLGRYVNRGSAELLVKDGQVMLTLDDGPAFAVSRIGENRYLARPKPGIAGPEFVVQPATKDAPAYLHFALWAYVKQ
jgi:CubicO group peptidase (beta-lactamase class C family)